MSLIPRSEWIPVNISHIALPRWIHSLKKALICNLFPHFQEKELHMFVWEWKRKAHCGLPYFCFVRDCLPWDAQQLHILQKAFFFRTCTPHCQEVLPTLYPAFTFLRFPLWWDQMIVSLSFDTHPAVTFLCFCLWPREHKGLKKKGKKNTDCKLNHS